MGAKSNHSEEEVLRMEAKLEGVEVSAREIDCQDADDNTEDEEEETGAQETQETRVQKITS